MSLPHRHRFAARVAQNLALCRDHYRLVLHLDRFPATQPGQFVQVGCGNAEESQDWQEPSEWPDDRPPILHGTEVRQPTALLRRPFSLAGRDDTADGVRLHLVHRVIGIGTAWLAGLNPGDSVNLIGPLGNAFAPPAQGIALLIGGGVGIPPMMYLAQYLAERGHGSKTAGAEGSQTAGGERSRTVAFAGALSRDLLPLTITGDSPPASADDPGPLYNVAEFARHGIPAVIATDDGSYGFRGFVTQALTAYLDRYFAVGTAGSPPGAGSRRIDSIPTLYCCGPEPMMKRVAAIAAEYHLPCQIAVDRAMACGMGACQSCVIKVKTSAQGNGAGWSYKLACADGPVFAAEDLLW